MSEEKEHSYPALWNKWLENLDKPIGERKNFEDFLSQNSASDNVKETLRLVATGGEY